LKIVGAVYDLANGTVKIV